MKTWTDSSFDQGRADPRKPGVPLACIAWPIAIVVVVFLVWFATELLP